MAGRNACPTFRPGRGHRDVRRTEIRPHVEDALCRRRADRSGCDPLSIRSTSPGLGVSRSSIRAPAASAAARSSSPEWRKEFMSFGNDFFADFQKTHGNNRGLALIAIKTDGGSRRQYPRFTSK